MIYNDSYGVVYTPKELSDFVAQVAVEEYSESAYPVQEVVALDPACGEGILLSSLQRFLSRSYKAKYIGIDIDSNAIQENKRRVPLDDYLFFHQNTILPSHASKAAEYWKERFNNASIIIANPPWSSQKIFEKKALSSAGYSFDVGQYDSYVLFLELCIKIIEENGIIAFIIPDSLFSGENKSLRKYICENTEIKVIARLGEKIFSNVNRSTSILVLKKKKPDENAQTKCYRLDTTDRKRFINGDLNLFESFHSKKHTIMQRRFSNNKNYIFDIDTFFEEEDILGKIEENKLVWGDIFQFGRGVEISKSGDIAICIRCKKAQGYSKKQTQSGKKICQYCGIEMPITFSQMKTLVSDNKQPQYIPMFVGENIKRYAFSGIKYIQPNVDGINYKQTSLYTPPKLLIRKTGLGIYASIDYNSTYTSQTVYLCKFINDSQNVPLEYYLGVLNSRLIYYYYLKKYGENEWKSHPYLTKDILFSLPLKTITEANYLLCLDIAKYAKQLQNCYSRRVDIELEAMIMKLYGITVTDLNYIRLELNRLPNLSAINQMRIGDDELCLDT